MTNEIIFNCVQFITNPSILDYNKTIQQAVCDHVEIPREYEKTFWEEVGREAVFQSIKRKRQTITVSMKKTFDTYCKEHKDGTPPPDPKTFVSPELFVPNITGAIVENRIEGNQGLGNHDEGNQAAKEHLQSSTTPQSQEKYIEFLTIFLRSFVHNKVYKDKLQHLLISEYLDVSLEAFGITVYASNYDYWLKKFWPSAGCESTLTTETAVPTYMLPKFTDRSRACGKFCGWTKEGMVFYNTVLQTLSEQRGRRGNITFDEKVCASRIESNKSSKKRT